MKHVVTEVETCALLNKVLRINSIQRQFIHVFSAVLSWTNCWVSVDLDFNKTDGYRQRNVRQFLQSA